MKNKIFLLIAFLMMLCIPFSVFAETCDTNNVVIKNIEQTNKSEGTDEKTEATIENNKINLDISMSEVEDYIEYQFNVENKSDEDLVFNEKSLTSEDNHFNYEFAYEDNSNIIKSHTDKDVTLTITYARVIDESEFENGTYKIEDTYKIGVMNQDLVNPKTSNYFAIIIKIILGIIIVFGLCQINNKYIKTLLLLLCLIPTTVYALCSYEMEICTNIEVSTIQGQVPVTDTIYWALQDNNNDGDYEKLIISNHEVTGSDNYQGSFAGTTEFNSYSDVPWHINSVVYSGIGIKIEEIDIEGIVAPTSTAYWFAGAGCSSSTFTANLRNLNVSNVTNMSHMFEYTGYNATTWNIGDLSGWNTSNVTNVYDMFFYAGYKTTTFDIGDLSRWNTSNVTNFGQMFCSAWNYATTFDIGDLSRWNTLQATNFEGMFNYAGKNATTWNIGNIGKWNISNATNISYMFQAAGYNTTNFNLDLSGWNTSNVGNMNGMFKYAGYNATTFKIDLSTWNTSSVVNDLYYMFIDAGKNATTWSVIIPSTNGSSINNDTTHLYGSGTLTYQGQTYASPPSGKYFTLA